MAYTKRYPGGFLDRPITTTPADSQFLNAVEAALVTLYGVAPAVDGALVWDGSKFTAATRILAGVGATYAPAAANTDLAVPTNPYHAMAPTGAGFSVRSFAAGYAGQRVSIRNTSAFSVTLKHIQGGGPTNLVLRQSRDFVLHAGSEAVEFIYDGGGFWLEITRDVDNIIFDQVHPGGNNVFTVSAIPADYRSLRWIFSGRSANASTTVQLLVQFNNDNAANYDYQSMGRAASTASGSETFGSAFIALGDFPAASAAANLSGQISGDIADYASTVFNKTITAMAGSKIGVSTGNMEIQSISGFWRNAAAITQCQFICSPGNFVAGSRLTVIGMP